jgi:predicted chitinase
MKQAFIKGVTYHKPLMKKAWNKRSYISQVEDETSLQDMDETSLQYTELTFHKSWLKQTCDKRSDMLQVMNEEACIKLSDMS